jgi:hypothetical protein
MEVVISVFAAVATVLPSLMNTVLVSLRRHKRSSFGGPVLSVGGYRQGIAVGGRELEVIGIGCLDTGSPLDNGANAESCRSERARGNCSRDSRIQGRDCAAVPVAFAVKLNVARWFRR